ncbi:hypothetical protein HCC61_11550 [Streptomyces sp. HNM0575]|uniref:hypothetical protein n=1 Tax=Streptomyces sp. HNM0575 TaxID=2716338 RepID=UPI00145F6E51|nr:hypothetical protein [Streptomyces sp. HNM0575]NLU73305.1 hypothetical protein [Streptomyces sp. HNM0575]
MGEETAGVVAGGSVQPRVTGRGDGDSVTAITAQGPRGALPGNVAHEFAFDRGGADHRHERKDILDSISSYGCGRISRIDACARNGSWAA